MPDAGCRMLDACFTIPLPQTVLS